MRALHNKMRLHTFFMEIYRDYPQIDIPPKTPSKPTPKLPFSSPLSPLILVFFLPEGDTTGVTGDTTL